MRATFFDKHSTRFYCRVLCASKRRPGRENTRERRDRERAERRDGEKRPREKSQAPPSLGCDSGDVRHGRPAVALGRTCRRGRAPNTWPAIGGRVTRSAGPRRLTRLMGISTGRFIIARERSCSPRARSRSPATFTLSPRPETSAGEKCRASQLLN